MENRSSNQQHTTDLYLLRIWHAEESGCEASLRGRVMHVVTGKAHSFRGLPELLDLLEQITPDSTPEKGEED